MKNLTNEEKVRMMSAKTRWRHIEMGLPILTIGFLILIFVMGYINGESHGESRLREVCAEARHYGHKLASCGYYKWEAGAP